MEREGRGARGERTFPGSVNRLQIHEQIDRQAGRNTIKTTLGFGKKKGNLT